MPTALNKDVKIVKKAIAGYAGGSILVSLQFFSGSHHTSGGTPGVNRVRGALR
jgi:hypothetical protein